MQETRSVFAYGRVLRFQYEVVKARNDGQPDPAVPADFSDWEHVEAIKAVKVIARDRHGLWSLDPDYDLD